MLLMLIGVLLQGQYELVDATELSKEIVRTIRQECGTPGSNGRRFTLLYFADVLRGSEMKKIVDAGQSFLGLAYIVD